MDIWTIVNSPLVLTILTLLWGSVVASWIAALWQKRNHHHELKLQYTREIVDSYQEYIRLIRGNKKTTKADFDVTHAAVMSRAKIIGYLFDNKEIGRLWVTVVDKLSSVFDLKLKSRNQSLVEKSLVDIYFDSNCAIELMFNELI